MMTPIILNLMPSNLLVKTLFYLSAFFSLYFCVLAFIETIHIIHSHNHPNYDWDAVVKEKKHTEGFHKTFKLIIYSIIYIIIVICLTIIFPFFHI